LISHPNKEDHVANPKGGRSRSAFIKSLALDLPGPEVVKKAKKAGLAISTQYVARVRWQMRAKGTGAGRLGGVANGEWWRAQAQPSLRRSDDQAARAFVLLVTTIGLRRAEGLLAELRKKIAAIRLG
jgi:hypothetical protein